MKGEIIQVGQVGIRFLLEAADTNGSVAMFEFTVPVGAKVLLPHYHKHYDETIYGIEGVITFTVEGKAVEIGPGECYFIPRGALHGFNNLKPANARALAVAPGLPVAWATQGGLELLAAEATHDRAAAGRALAAYQTAPALNPLLARAHAAARDRALALGR